MTGRAHGCHRRRPGRAGMGWPWASTSCSTSSSSASVNASSGVTRVSWSASASWSGGEDRLVRRGRVGGVRVGPRSGHGPVALRARLALVGLVGGHRTGGAHRRLAAVAAADHERLPAGLAPDVDTAVRTRWPQHGAAWVDALPAELDAPCVALGVTPRRTYPARFAVVVQAGAALVLRSSPDPDVEHQAAVLRCLADVGLAPRLHAEETTPTAVWTVSDAVEPGTAIRDATPEQLSRADIMTVLRALTEDRAEPAGAPDLASWIRSRLTMSSLDDLPPGGGPAPEEAPGGARTPRRYRATTGREALSRRLVARERAHRPKSPLAHRPTASTTNPPTTSPSPPSKPAGTIPPAHARQPPRSPKQPTRIPIEPPSGCPSRQLPVSER